MPQLPTASLTRRGFAAILLAGVGTLRSGAVSGQGKTQYTFLVLGTDKRTDADREHADVIMVSRVDTAAGTVRTLSIPRDLYVEIPGIGWDKINAAFSHAVGVNPQLSWDVGAAATANTIEQRFGLAIDGVAHIAMWDFHKLIGAVGVFTVNNPYEVYAEAWDTTFPAGVIELNGDTALKFCRTRSQDGDGGRVMRQHLVLMGILEKLQDPANLPRIPQMIVAMQDVVHTDISPAVQAELIPLIPTLETSDLAFTNIESQLWADTSASGAWIYQGDWTTLPGYVQSWLAGEIP